MSHTHSTERERGGREGGGRGGGGGYLTRVTSSLESVKRSASVVCSRGTAASSMTNTPDTALRVFTAATLERSNASAYR